MNKIDFLENNFSTNELYGISSKRYDRKKENFNKYTIQQWRTIRDLSIEEVSKRANISESSLWSYEISRDRFLSMELADLLNIASALSISFYDIAITEKEYDYALKLGIYRNN